MAMQTVSYTGPLASEALLSKSCLGTDCISQRKGFQFLCLERRDDIFLMFPRMLYELAKVMLY